MQGCFFFLFILNYFSSVDTNEDLKGMPIDRYPCEKHMGIFFLWVYHAIQYPGIRWTSRVHDHKNVGNQFLN